MSKATTNKAPMEPETMATPAAQPTERTPVSESNPAPKKKPRAPKAKKPEPVAAPEPVTAPEPVAAPEPPKKKARKSKANAAAEPAAETAKKKERRKSAFALFRGDFCKANKGTMAFEELNKACCEAWHALDEEAKAKWVAQRDELYPPSDKPKKPPTAWILYLNDYRGKLKEAGETLSVLEVTKKAAEAWKALDAEAKAAWKPAA